MSAPGSDPDLVADLGPARPPGLRVVPARATWTPGAERLVPDAVLGAGVELPGAAGALELAFPDGEQPRTALTLTAWVRWGGPLRRDPAATPPPPAVPGPPVLTVALARPRVRRARLEIAIGPDRPQTTVDLDTPTGPPPSAGERLDPGGWHHLAVVWDGPARTVRVLVDGRRVAEHPTTVDHLPFRGGARVVIARQGAGARLLMVGPVRLYRRSRTDAEILAERHADLAAHPTADERAPLAFRLSDAADEPTLSITDDDAPGRALHVVLENRSPFPVPLPPARGPLADRLELRFRPGCLAGAAHDWAEPGPPGWRVRARRDDDGAVSLFLGTVEARTLAPGAATVFTLDHVRAAGDLGAHGTHVELSYPHPHLPGTRCVRVAVARVVGRRGRRRCQLRLAVAGEGTVVNDAATPNTVVLHLANTSRSLPVALQAPVAGVGTSLVLSFDAGSDGDVWALASTDQLLGATVSVHPPDWRVEVESLDEAPEWVLTPTRDQLLGPSDRIVITVEKLVTGMPAGRALATVRLENVPGHWDGEHGVEIVKVPPAPPAHPPPHDELPAGSIVLWHLAAGAVPEGWVVCDGTRGTPSLAPPLGSPGAANDPFGAVTIILKRPAGDVR
ncbi:MAG: LamG-like jellyroll fold domain-containing protein [Pseudonocardia sp.]